MKNKILKVVVILLSIAFVLSSCKVAFAFTSYFITEEQDGINAMLNFDKKEYELDETVDVSLIVTNYNSYKVKNIQSEIILPDSVKLVLGDLKLNSFDLDDYRSQVHIVRFEKNVVKNDIEEIPNEEITNSPQTGDNVAIYIAMMVISASALVVIAVKKKWVCKNDVMLLVLCFTLVGAMTLTSVVNADATTKEFTVEGTIKYDGEDVVIKGKVTYTHEIYSKLQIDGTDKGMYVEGDTVTITAEDAPEGKHFTGWTVVKGNVTLADKNSKTTTFVMGNEEVEIKANYEVNTYTITSTANAGGSITGSKTVNYGDSKTFTITPNAHYHIEKVVVDGEDKGINNTYTFTDVKGNHTIDVTFAIDTSTITTKTNAGGSITGNTIVNYNDNTIFTITPDTGYGVVDVKVDGTSIGAVTSYEFKNVVNNHTIEVVFGVTTGESFISAIGRGGTVELASDITLSSSYSLSNFNTTINGNGFNVYKQDYTILMLNSSYNLTLNNVNFEPIILSSGNENCTLTLNGGKYKSSILIDGGKIKIMDGVFKYIVISGTGSVTIDHGTFYYIQGSDINELIDSDNYQVTQTKDSDGVDIWVVTEK